MTHADPMSVLRQRTSGKWRAYPPDVLPMFVAEMDYPLAPAIREALHAAIDAGDTGYANPYDRSAAEAFASFAEDTWGWAPDPSGMSMTTDVSVVIVEALRRLMKPGDPVIITPPIYPPFYDLIPEAGGVVAEVPLTAEGLDLDGIEQAMAAGARGVLLCNPHNPLGLVHTRQTLVELAEIVARNDGFVLSDEIHAPLTHHGQQFTPYLSVSDAARTHGITAASGSKAFNLAGLKCAFFIAQSEQMAALVDGLPAEVGFRTGQFGLIATREGFAHSRDWLSDTIAAIESNVALLAEQLHDRLPEVTMCAPDASYLAWLDFTGLGLGDDPARVLVSRAKVALSSGPDFGSPGRGHARMNLACAPETVIEAVDRIAAAV